MKHIYIVMGVTSTGDQVLHVCSRYERARTVMGYYNRSGALMFSTFYILTMPIDEKE